LTSSGLRLLAWRAAPSLLGACGSTQGSGPTSRTKVFARVVRRYDEERLLSALGYVTPADYYRGHPSERYSARRAKVSRARHQRKEMNLEFAAAGVTLPWMGGSCFIGLRPICAAAVETIHVPICTRISLHSDAQQSSARRCAPPRHESPIRQSAPVTSTEAWSRPQEVDSVSRKTASLATFQAGAAQTGSGAARGP
jgi:hypothetical protein